jgi:hypothetical protein
VASERFNGSSKFKNNYAYFQIVLLAYNLWRYYKLLAQKSNQEPADAKFRKSLDAEVDRLCNAARYERTEGRRDTQAGHYDRKLHTRAGEV